MTGSNDAAAVAAGLTVLCNKCSQSFMQTEAKRKQGKRTCPNCERAYFAQRRAERRAKGLPVSGSRSSAEYKRAYDANYRTRDGVKTKIAARSKVLTAIRSGALVKQPCQVCGESDTEAHHEDYRKPLDVWWLCKTHHAARHREIGDDE